MKVLITATNLLPVLAEWRPYFEEQGAEVIAAEVNERLSEAELLPLVADIDGAVVGDDDWNAKVIAAAPQLKVLSKWGTGIDSIDQAACAEAGVVVRNVTNAFTDPVADTTMSYALSLLRQVPATDADMKNGVWHKRPVRCLAECTVGVIGLGNIGQAVAKRMRAAGATVLGNDVRELEAARLAELEVTLVPKEQLLAEADIISLNCDLNPSSHHILGEAEFSQMRQGVLVINTARGPLIDEPALVAALENGTVGGAGLDVFEDEPLPSDSRLRSMSNVLLAPHNANSSPRAYQAVHQASIDNVFSVLQPAQVPVS
mgnify:CR=1 FL=1